MQEIFEAYSKAYTDQIGQRDLLERRLIDVVTDNYELQ